MTLEELTKGRIVQHFKRELMTDAQLAAEPAKYTYEIIGTAMHTETEETLVIYRALYGEGGLWVRPAKMFFETIERDGKKMKRFELVDGAK